MLSNLSKQQKAQILAQKNAHLFPHKKIADNFGVARRTVVNLNEFNVDEETIALSKKYQRQLSARIDRINDKILDNIEAQVTEGKIPAYQLSTIFGTIYDKQRLHNNQATTISQQNLTEEQLALDMLRAARIAFPDWLPEQHAATVLIKYPNVSTQLLLTSGDEKQ